MPDTSLGFTYPASTDHVRLWEHLQTLAVDLNDYLANRGFIVEDVRTTASGSFTTTETVLQSATWTAVPTVTYEIMCLQSIQSTVANDIATMRIRYQSGPTLTTAGTQLRIAIPNLDVATRGQMQVMWAKVTGLTGQHTAGITAQRTTGSGSLSSFGSASMENVITVKGY